MCPQTSLARLAERHPKLLYRASFAALDRRNPMPLYTYQSWPVLLTPSEIEDMEARSLGLSRLFRSLPQRLFQSDPARLAAFYDLDDEIVTTLIMAPPNGIEHAPYRGDYIVTADGLKLIEFNGGTGLAGWIVALGAPLYDEVPVLADVLAAEGMEMAHPTNSLEALLSYFLDRVLVNRHYRDTGEVNLAVAVVDEDAGMYNPASEVLCREVYRKLRRGKHPDLGGEFYFLRYSQVEARDGGLFYRDHRGAHRLHAVFEQKVDDESGRRNAYRSFKTGRLDLYSGPATLVITDKRNLALLSSRCDEPCFDDAERELIRSTIPWTRLLDRGETEFRGEPVALPDLIGGRREDLVLKRGVSFGGEFVHIGRLMSPAEWERAAREALEEDCWIVQEYLPSVPYELQHGDRGSTPHDVVWGLFTLEDRFGGGFLRMTPRERGGLINVSHGAQVSPMMGVRRQ